MKVLPLRTVPSSSHLSFFRGLGSLSGGFISFRPNAEEMLQDTTFPKATTSLSSLDMVVGAVGVFDLLQAFRLQLSTALNQAVD